MIPHGNFNAEKCIQYLRHVGVGVTEEQAQSWRDAEAVHRFLRSTRRIASEGVRMRCAMGHEWTGVFYRRGSGYRGQEAHNRATAKCPKCEQEARILVSEWVRARDGTITDDRPESDRWKPLGDYAAHPEGGSP